MHASEGERAPTRRELRGFGLTVGAAFLALAALLLWRGRPGAAYLPGALGVSLVLLGWLAPALLASVRRGWMALARALSRITTPMFMAVVFFGVVTPLALAMRVAGRRPLARRREAATFWVDREPGAGRSDLRRQF